MKNAQQASKEVLTATTPIKKITKIYSVFFFLYKLSENMDMCVRDVKNQTTLVKLP